MHNHPQGPLGLNPVKMKPLPPPVGQAICLDCGAWLCAHSWDGLFEEMSWHDPRHIVHVWDDLNEG